MGDGDEIARLKQEVFALTKQVLTLKTKLMFCHCDGLLIVRSPRRAWECVRARARMNEFV